MEYYEFKKEDAYEFARASRIQTKQRGDELQFLSCPYCRGGKNGDKGTFSISLVTGQFKCLRSSCSVSGNIITLARDFDYFSLGKDIDAYYQTGKQKRFRRFKKMLLHIWKAERSLLPLLKNIRLRFKVNIRILWHFLSWMKKEICPL